MGDGVGPPGVVVVEEEIGDGQTDQRAHDEPNQEHEHGVGTATLEYHVRAPRLRGNHGCGDHGLGHHGLGHHRGRLCRGRGRWRRRLVVRRGRRWWP